MRSARVPRSRWMPVVVALTAAFATSGVAGAASFDPPASYPTGGVRPLALAVGNVTGDANNDIVVANNLSDTVSLLPGLATGGFGAATSYRVGGAPAAVAIADLNGDTAPDLVVANRTTNNVSVLLAADGTFSPATTFGAGTQPYGVVVADLNRDGAKDLVVANRVSDDVSLLIGRGDGTFAPGVSAPAGDGPIAIAAGDLNGDGPPDIAVALFDGDLMSILFGDGAGHLAAPALYTAGNGPQDIVVGDLREDGRPDIAVANYFNNYASVFLGQGSGVFSRQSGFGAGTGPRSLAIGDLDGDHHRDLAIADADSDMVSVLRGDGNGFFAPRQDFPGGDAPSSIAIAQLDGQGLPDIVVADRFAEAVSVLRNTTTPPDETPPALTVPGAISLRATAAAGERVDFTVSATDDREPSPTVTCTPASGSLFAVGTTTVDCRATDAAGNHTDKSFTVEVLPPDTTPPTITVPADLTLDATTTTGAIVTYSASAVDAIDLSPTLACDPASGAMFANGTTNVTCNASDHAGNHSSASFNITIIPLDTEAPTITVPGPITVDAHVPAGISVSYAVSAVDKRDSLPTLVCTPPSGATFAPGVTTVNCIAHDAAGNSSNASFMVTVIPPDTTPPVLSVPSSMTADATSARGAAVTYGVSAVDDRDLDPIVACAPPSGTIFAPGTTTVDCSARDHAGNASAKSFTIRVSPLDTTAPTITVPGPITVNAVAPNGALVTFSVAASDDRDAVATVTCAPASGATFPIAVTTVQCSSRDASGNIAKNSFTVRVKGAAEQIADLVDKIRGMASLAPLAVAIRVQLESMATCAITNKKTQACAGVPLVIAAIKLAVTRKYLTTAQGDSLIADIQRIKSVIGCP
jgi:hypothetical protein